jgi:hypothetical protein
MVISQFPESDPDDAGLLLPLPHELANNAAASTIAILRCISLISLRAP